MGGVGRVFSRKLQVSGKREKGLMGVMIVLCAEWWSSGKDKASIILLMGIRFGRI